MPLSKLLAVESKIVSDGPDVSIRLDCFVFPSNSRSMADANIREHIFLFENLLWVMTRQIRISQACAQWSAFMLKYGGMTIFLLLH